MSSGDRSWCRAVAVAYLGGACVAGSTQAREAEVLKVTVGPSTTLSPAAHENCSSLAVSRTGAVAAFYPPRPGVLPKAYRVSTDGGLTWGKELASPAALGGGACSTGLREGGVIKMLGQATPVADAPDAAKRLFFSDDFLHHETAAVSVDLPGAALQTRWARFYPVFDKGKIVQLDSGALLATMYGNLEGDQQYRTLLVRSMDGGLTWRYHATVAYDPNDPDPDLVGQYCGFCEPSLAQLADGRLLCIMRTQGTHLPAEYRPLYVSWSADLGTTWTKPVPTQPHLMNIWPTLAVLDNGVVACAYGRPGFHVVFSTDAGRTWGDRVSFSHQSVNDITGQVDMVKTGPNRLLAIGSIEGGTQVFPITVERVRVSPARVALTGRVLDEQGSPIPGVLVELGPNRYVADSYIQPGEDAPLDNWGAAPVIEGPPVLRYQSIRKENGYPTVETDTQGRFRFDSVALGETIVTVEAPGYAPRYRRIRVAPELIEQEFRLRTGASVRGRVVNAGGDPLPGMCMVVERSHIHSDGDGFFHWAVEAPLPEQVDIKVYKLYSRRYETLESTVPFSLIEREPITVKKKQ